MVELITGLTSAIEIGTNNRQLNITYLILVEGSTEFIYLCS
jgi:hypothetical protein